MLSASILAYCIGFGCPVGDRTMLIIDFMAKRAWAATGTIRVPEPVSLMSARYRMGAADHRGRWRRRYPVTSWSTVFPVIFGGNSCTLPWAFVRVPPDRPRDRPIPPPEPGDGSVHSAVFALRASHMKNWQLLTTRLSFVPRPRLFNFVSREDRTVANEGWSPGEPLTEQLEVMLTLSSWSEYRRSKGASLE